MRDVYLYEDCSVLKNLLNIKDKTLLEDTEAAVTEMREKLWNNMTGHEVAIQFADSLAKLWRVHPFREN